MNTSIFPQHIAIIMDGNGRWAQQRHLPRVAGHKAGLDAVRQVVKSCVEKKIAVLTLFAFSSENWRRPIQEVSYLMDLFTKALKYEAQKLHKQNIQLRVIGDRTQFDNKLRKLITSVEAMTAHNTGLKLVVAANYGGQWDICMACKMLAEEIEQGRMLSRDITLERLQEKMSLSDLPSPDLLIRTSGEQRISNFMLWQLAYSELYFSEVLWPDFNEAEFEKAISFFTQRERRFGYISEQLKRNEHA